MENYIKYGRVKKITENQSIIMQAQSGHKKIKTNIIDKLIKLMVNTNG